MLFGRPEFSLLGAIVTGKRWLLLVVFLRQLANQR